MPWNFKKCLNKTRNLPERTNIKKIEYKTIIIRQKLKIYQSFFEIDINP